MSLITDAAQAALSPRAAVISWHDGLPWEAECPTCGLPCRITLRLARHGPLGAQCSGSGALVVVTEASLDGPEVDQ